MLRYAVTQSAHLEGSPYDFLKHSYIPYFETLGLLPVLIPNTISDPCSYFEALDLQGLVLTGGGDLEPRRYGQENHGSTEIAPLRDDLEHQLLQMAVSNSLPVLAICRGMQFLNVFFGGQLVQDLPTQLDGALNHRAGFHPAAILDSRVAELLGTATLEVNSYHHQGVISRGLGSPLEIFAICEADGVVEGVLHPDLPILGVQWHPERPAASPQAAQRDITLIHAFLQGIFWK